MPWVIGAKAQRLGEPCMDDTNNLLTYHEITSLQDTRYDAWLDIYQASFPLPEQMLVSQLNRIVRALDSDPSRRTNAACMLAVSAEGEPVGIAQYTINTEMRRDSKGEKP